MSQVLEEISRVLKRIAEVIRDVTVNNLEVLKEVP